MRHLLVLVSAVVALATAPAQAQATTIGLGEGTRAVDMAFDPEGKLWFTAWRFGADGFSNLVGHTTTGAIHWYQLPSRQYLGIGSLAIGEDGSLWFADTARGALGRVDPIGVVSELPLAPADSSPQDLAVAPDGAIWITQAAVDQVSRVAPDGSTSSFALPTGAAPSGIAAAPDGAVWVTETGRNRIARITSGGSLREWDLPHPDSRPDEIVRGAGGNFWFSERGGARVGRIGLGIELAEYEVPGAGGTGAIAAAPDGGVFFANGFEVGSLSALGTLTGIGCPTPACDLPINALTVGPEGRLWYATGLRATKGGGATAILELYASGIVGTFDPPKPRSEVTLGSRALLRGRFALIPVQCTGGVGVLCRGRLLLRARSQLSDCRNPRSGPLLGQRRYRLADGAQHRFAVRIGRPAMRLLQQCPFRRVSVQATVHDGPPAIRHMRLLRQGRR